MFRCCLSSCCVVLYHRHILKESYNKDTILPLSDSYAIIPTGSVTPSANIFPQNKIKSFKVKDPLFSIETPYYDALLNIVHLVKYGDEYDAINFVESRKDANVFQVLQINLSHPFVDILKKSRKMIRILYQRSIVLLLKCKRYD